jgi:hypothetical protein
MSNLLPEKQQQNVRSEYRARFILSGSYLAISAALFTALTLLPSFGVLFISRPETLAQATQAQQGKTDSGDITRAQSLISQVTPIVSASSTITAAILGALSEKPSGVHIDNIVYNSGVAATIAIAGSADSRALTDNYRTKLQTNPIFTSVKLPVGDLLGAQSGRFTITLAGHF